MSCVREYLELPDTTKERRLDLEHFMDFAKLTMTGTSIVDVTPKLIKEFIDYKLNVVGEQASTVKRRFYLVRGFFKYLEGRYRTYSTPFVDVKPPRIPLPVSDRISEEDIAKIRAYLPTIKDRAERQTISLKFDMAFDNGMRPMDFVNVTVAHLDLVNGLIVDLVRKGGFVQTLTLTSETVRNLKRYLPTRQRLLINSGIFRFESLPQNVQDEYPLFPSTHNNKLKNRLNPEEFKLSNKTIYNRMTTVCRRAGVKMNPMQCRHTFAQELYDETLDLQLVQQAMGHTTPLMTQRYVARPLSRIREQMEFIRRKAA